VPGTLAFVPRGVLSRRSAWLPKEASMADVLTPAHIHPDAIYQEGQARLLLGLTGAALARGKCESIPRNQEFAERIVDSMLLGLIPR